MATRKAATMKRTPLEDGGWFNREASEVFDEDTYWDGRNQASCATRSQWEHEQLYITRHGRCVLEHSSQWQGARTTYREISLHDAAEWLTRNHHPAPAALAKVQAEQER